MPIKIDMSDATSKGGSFDEPLPSGNYPCTVFDVQLKGPGPSGFHYIEMTLQTTNPELNQRRFWTNFSLAPNAKWKLKETLVKCFGFDPAIMEGEAAKTFELEPRELLGKACVARIKVGSWQGKERNEVDEVLPEGTPEAVASGAWM